MVERGGKFIVVEGSDSSGKELQSKKLSTELQKRGFNVHFLDFPRYEDFFGSVVGRYLVGEFGDVYDVSPVLVSFPYALDRWEKSDEIRSLKKEGKIVLSNRFTESNLAFMSAKLPESKREEFIEWVEELEQERLNIPKADVAIFLHVPAKVGQKLTMQKDEKSYMKGKGRGDIHERNINYLETVIQQYLWMTKNRDHWIEIMCVADGGKMLDPETIHKEVVARLEEKGII